MKNSHEPLEETNEIDRIHTLKIFENSFYEKDFTKVCGVDEAGRGPLAGPVVACAVVLPKDAIILGINDSKKLSEKKRELLFDEIHKVAISIGIGIVDCNTIDNINILNATFLAMRKAIESLTVTPDMCLVDGNLLIRELDLPQQSIVKGDSKSISIASASIIAKVTRDRLMLQYDELYPEYSFKNNKGYGTKNHKQAILTHGACPIHRNSFLTKIL